MDQLVHTYHSKGVSRKVIAQKIVEAGAGLLRVCSYSDKEMDMATAIFRTGGRRLVYATHKGLNLPSINTIRSRTDITHLQPSVGTITHAEIHHNISEVFGKDHPAIPRCGHSIMTDEINLDERAVYLKFCQSVGGLCREHSKDHNLQINDYEAMEQLAETVHGPKPTVHYAKEATVIGIAPFRQDDYDVRPIVISGTCKTETALGSANMHQMVLDAWRTNPNGEARHGPIWSVASDGDGTRHRAFYLLFMKKPLDESDPLYDILSKLIGLNLAVGEFNVNGEFDIKHIIKHSYHYFFLSIKVNLYFHRYLHSHLYNWRNYYQ